MYFLTWVLSFLMAMPSPPAEAGFPFPFAFWKSAGVSWPIGADGAFTCNSGTCIVNGNLHDYTNITIAAGATMSLQTANHQGVVIGWTGTFTNNGTIQAQYGFIADGTYSVTAPDGYVLSYTVTAADNSMNTSGVGGCSANAAGIGSVYGGGAGGENDNVQTDGTGQDGSHFTGTGGSCSGTWGSGGTLYGGAGQSLGGCSGSVNQVQGAAAGGGARGAHGIGVYLKAGPSATTAGTGVINASGSTGGAGGTASSPVNNTKIGSPHAVCGGAAGGGASGGSGAKIAARFKTSTPGWIFNVSGGAGGAGGAVGALGSGSPRTLGSAGQSGSTGNAGTTDIATY